MALWWAMLAVLAAAASVEGQIQNDCAAKLVDCAQYLNSSQPSAECCNAIKQVVATQLPCLCQLVNHPNLLPGINMTQALNIPKHCNLSDDTSSCRASGPASSSARPPPIGSGGGGGGNKNGAAGGRVPCMGMVALLSIWLATLF